MNGLVLLEVIRFVYQVSTRMNVSLAEAARLGDQCYNTMRLV